MDLTILIISYKSLPKLDRCISHLGNSHKVIVIENSNNYTIKKNIEKKFSFCEVITNDRNLGYGAAANIGYKKINTDFALLINTDTLINESEINEIKNEIVKKEQELIDEELKNSGKPDDIAKKISLGKINKFKQENSLMTQDWVMEPKKKVQDIISELAKPELKIREFIRMKIGE